MNKVKKTHAKDYLIEYKAKKETPYWLGFLIQKAIDTNGKISDEDKDKIFEVLLKENKIDTEEKIAVLKNNTNNTNNEESETPPANKKLTLQKITHKKGVNALILNQSIAFSPACTIIFGLNGTGKSGYFRIIHELAGGVKVKDILDNIHKQGDGLEVDIDFSLDNNTQNHYKWRDKSVRGIAPFDQIKVFDSEYLPIFLNERESSVNIEPLGLNLFQVVATIIDEFKEKLDQAKLQKSSQKPDLQTLIDVIHSDELKLLLQKSLLTEKESQQLDDNKTFSSEETAKLVQLKQDKASLEKNNTEDSKKVLNQEKKEIDELKDHLFKLKTNLKIQTEDISVATDLYLKRKRIRDERVKQFEVLKNIPSQETEEWQIFIESAEGYGVKIEQTVFNKNEKCVYCHQPLGEEAIKLVQAYAQYLGDQSQQNFKNSVDDIVVLKTKLDDLITEFSFSENLKKSLTDISNKQSQTYKILIDKIIREANNQKTILEKVLNDKVLISNGYSLGLLGADKKLAELSKKKQETLDDLQQSESQKKQKIGQLEEEINALEDKQNVTKWKTKIEEYFLCYQSVQKYTAINQTIITTGITTLGKKAHDELLTESIRESFEEELKALGKDIEVTLDPAGAGKGTVFTKLKILGNDVCDILSDGEQKAVGLALFLAEIESQINDCPIVFDDPVTSVDHEVADFLAKKLLQLSLNRQIIIFTHNKLFYDSFVFWSSNLKDEQDNKTHHLCKNYGNGNKCKDGCHVYTYKVDREAKDKIGRIFEAQNESCQYYIEKAENEIKGDYSLSCVAGYLKSAIEHYIDEKVMNNQRLVKDQRIKDHIEWDMLKGLNPDKILIDQLKIYWDNLSNRGTHLSENSSENPLKTEDLNNIITFLKL